MEAKKKRERGDEVGEEKKGTAEQTYGQNAERHKYNEAQRPQQVTLWQSRVRRQVFMGKNGILVVLRGGVQGWRA